VTRQFTTCAPALRTAEINISVPWRRDEIACTCPAWCHRVIVLRGYAVIRWPGDIVALTTDTKAADAAVRLLSGAAAVVLLAMVLFGCAAHARAVKPAPAAITTELRFGSCMSEPPPFDAIDWPTPDSVGNVLMHASTVERVQNAYAELRRYALENYFRCLHVAEELGEQSATVEVVP
jgi:hypothetical protein